MAGVKIGGSSERGEVWYLERLDSEYRSILTQVLSGLLGQSTPVEQNKIVVLKPSLVCRAVEGEFECLVTISKAWKLLYAALTRQGAEAEYDKFLSNAGVELEQDKPRDLVTILADLKLVLNQTSKTGAFVDPTSPFLTGDKPEDWEKCRKLADVSWLEGYSGILAPSSALEG